MKVVLTLIAFALFQFASRSSLAEHKSLNLLLNPNANRHSPPTYACTQNDTSSLDNLACDNFYEYACGNRPNYENEIPNIEEKIIVPELDRLEAKLKEISALPKNESILRKLKIMEEAFNESRNFRKENRVPDNGRDSAKISPERTLAKILLLKSGVYTTDAEKNNRMLDIVMHLFPDWYKTSDGTSIGRDGYHPTVTPDNPLLWRTTNEETLELDSYRPLARISQKNILDQIEALPVVAEKKQLLEFTKRSVIEFYKKYSTHPKKWNFLIDGFKILQTPTGMPNYKNDWSNRLSLRLQGVHETHHSLVLSLGNKLFRVKQMVVLFNSLLTEWGIPLQIII